ncbi:hypothetical protein FJR48_06505 [Sulfurimonas lithotrophica]|uniref:Uncharacterized protein n=1 Tax=Sulfurimonas lithotrophica TaxID=2590022 RepID=A0A5P8P149_9BACT|nr:hypothetical protein [Sulfurimonas lithotrophica]QFR49394.1 hypothetical protein FJR48_06505 [Sulfurimonas lithotrophica]
MIKFDKKAMQKFNEIPDDLKSQILSNVYCSNCQATVKIIDFTATLESGDLILNGKCEKCGGKVVRLLEMSLTEHIYSPN